MPSPCGRQKLFRFGSLPTMKVRTCGYVRATASSQAAKAAGDAAPASISLGGYGYTANTGAIPAAAAVGTATSRNGLSGIARGELGRKRTVITFCLSPADAI